VVALCTFTNIVVMKLKFFVLVLLGLMMVSATPPQSKIRIHIAGDSTAQTYDVNRNLMRGWGQFLASFFNENVEVLNRSIGGRSSGSFIREGRWDTLLEQVQPGDYVLVQFGHNDTSPMQGRHVEPADYTANFLKFCADVKAKNAFPVILTSIPMREFDANGKVEVRRAHFAEYIELARQAAKTAGVPLIDVHEKGKERLQAVGDEASKALYYFVEEGKGLTPQEKGADNTHLQEAGAVMFAGIVAEGIREQKIQPLAGYLK